MRYLILCSIVVSFFAIQAQDKIKIQEGYSVFLEGDSVVSDTLLTSVKEFSKKGVLTLEKETSSFQNQKSFNQRTYNPKGDLILFEKSYFDGQLTTKEEYFYNEKGEVEKVIIQDLKGKQTLKVIPVIGKQQKVERLNFIDSTGKEVKYTIFMYDVLGNKTQENDFESPNYLLESKFWEYENGKVKKYTEFDSKTKKTFVKEYFYTNNLLTKEMLTEGTVLISEKTLEYNSNGNCILERKSFLTDKTKVNIRYNYQYW